MKDNMLQKNRKIVFSFLGAFLLTVMMYGIFQWTSKESIKNAETKEDSKTIVTSFYPLAFMTEQIVGETAEVTNLAGSVSVHAYTPSPQDIVKMNNADVVIAQGEVMEPWVGDTASDLESKGVEVLEVLEHVDLYYIDEHENEDNHVEDDHGEESHEDEDEHGEEEMHEDEEGHDDHDHGNFDPHTWLDFILAQQMVDEIVETVSKAYPENKEFYVENGKILKEKFASWDQNYTETLAKCSINEVIVSHNAYGYLERRYGFKAHAIAGISPQDEPSAKLLEELKKESEEGITHILIESNSSQVFAETLSSESGLELLSLNPLGRGTLDSEKDFFDIVAENLESFKVSLGCKI